MTAEQKRKRWNELIDKLIELALKYEKTYYRLQRKNPDRADYWHNRRQLLYKYSFKGNRHLSYPHRRFESKFGQNDGYVFGIRRSRAEAWWKQQVADRKERGRLKFEKTHYYYPWFFSERLDADYGTYICDQCGWAFHHSPSTIKRAAKTVYICCCGYCTNSIIKADHNSEPFS